jgi:hypothetical protein
MKNTGYTLNGMKENKSEILKSGVDTFAMKITGYTSNGVKENKSIVDYFHCKCIGNETRNNHSDSNTFKNFLDLIVRRYFVE